MGALKLESTELEDKELLLKIIDKAKSAGFKFRNMIDDYEYFSITSFNPETGRLAIVLRNDNRHQIIYESIYLLFFDLTFAKALFNNDWEKHLEGLALSENKLQYIYSNLTI